jgi:hypothetical protein
MITLRSMEDLRQTVPCGRIVPPAPPCPVGLGNLPVCPDIREGSNYGSVIVKRRARICSIRPDKDCENHKDGSSYQAFKHGSIECTASRQSYYHGRIGFVRFSTSGTASGLSVSTVPVPRFCAANVIKIHSPKDTIRANMFRFNHATLRTFLSTTSSRGEISVQAPHNSSISDENLGGHTVSSRSAHSLIPVVSWCHRANRVWAFSSSTICCTMESTEM